MKLRFNMKLCLLALSLVCLPALASLPKWSYVWDANELPEAFQDGEVFGISIHNPDDVSIVREIIDETFHCITAYNSQASTANVNYWTKEGVYDASLPSTIEWRFKNLDAVAYTNVLQITQLGVGYVGFKYFWNHGSNPYEVNSFAQIYADAQGWSTVRVLVNTIGGAIVSADMFYKNDQDEWVYANSSNLTANPAQATERIIVGDIGGNWGGEWYEDYLKIANGVATLDEIYSADTNIADLNGDGYVDFEDLVIFVSEWLEK